MDPNRGYESQDSEDSNRESADANDYPEEEEEDKEYGNQCDEDCSSDDEYGEQHRKRKHRNSDSDIDEDEAAKRYNQKQGPLASWLDKIQRKSKSGATQSYTMQEMLAN